MRTPDPTCLTPPGVLHSIFTDTDKDMKNTCFQTHFELLSLDIFQLIPNSPITEQEGQHPNGTLDHKNKQKIC